VNPSGAFAYTHRGLQTVRWVLAFPVHHVHGMEQGLHLKHQRAGRSGRLWTCVLIDAKHTSLGAERGDLDVMAELASVSAGGAEAGSPSHTAR
jgi:hypothetical protein